ncbi:MAG: trypsin-like peptidase domain-containing protein [Deltaproteobacteria bacterium]
MRGAGGAALGLLIATLAGCKDSTPPPATTSIADVGASIVAVHVGDRQGSGFVVAPGFILTNHHVVQNSSTGTRLKISFSSPLEEGHAVVARSRPDLDLALLRCVPGFGRCQNSAAVPIGASIDIRAGDTVFAFGSPVGLENTLTKGIVSNTARRYGEQAVIQTDLAVNQGNSGGPLLDAEGRAIGVVTAKMVGLEGIAFAVPIEYATQGDDPALAGHFPVEPISAVLRQREQEASTQRSMKPNPGSRVAPTRRAPPPPPTYRPRPERPKFEPQISNDLSVVRADWKHIEFRLKRPISEALTDRDQFELVKVPHNGLAQYVRKTPLPKPKVINILDDQMRSTRSYRLGMQVRPGTLHVGNSYHLLLNGKTYSAPFRID